MRMTQWDVFTPQRTRSGGVRLMRETHSLAEPDSTLQPILHHHSTNIMNTGNGMARGEESKIHATLSLSTIKNNKEGNGSLQVLSSQLGANNIDSMISEKNKKILVSIFQLLHPILVSSSKQEFHRKYNDFSYPTVLNDRLFDIASLDTTCLFQCIYALSTGKLPPFSASETSELESTIKKKVIVQVFAIAEMIRSQSIPVKKKDDEKGEKGFLREYVGKQLLVNCAPQALYRILNQIGISTSNETVRIEGINDCKNKILKGYSLEGKKYDLFLLLFDNLGFRVRGGKNKKIGYDEYTALQIVNIKKASLIEWGVYPNKEKNIPGKYNIIVYV